ncbi:hypothetical protein DFH94DRAFT_71072 [Russula ochroleuca]|uniref:Uncharacterized protein n=1 Tax=Russula ochroleuca TaxID=152965 RepID=A0A9P5MP36_9AGAM|nr:hypothetical protein DFH94DRAFT_71072 [Russula ochroleuca]
MLSSSNPSLDASGLLASRLLQFLANKRPSTQSSLGDQQRDEARTLAGELDASIDTLVDTSDPAAVNTLPSSQEHIPTVPAPPDKLSSDYVQNSPADDKQCINAISTPSSSTQEHGSTLRITHRNRQDIPVDAGAVIVTTILNAMAKQLPSSQEKRGDDKLDRAREIMDEFKSVIAENNLGTIEDKITHAREVKAALEVKSRISYRRNVKYAVEQQCVNIISGSSPTTPEHVPTSPPALTPPDDLASDPMRDLLTSDQRYITAVNALPSPSQAHIPISPPSAPDEPLSNHMHDLSTRDRQCVNATGTSSSSTEEHVPTSQSPPLRSLTPDKMQPTLSCWIKNMKKLSSLIDGLEDLASSAPAEHRSQLSEQIMTLRATSKKQQEHFMEFLQLSEEYADRYLFDISAGIEQQSSFLDKLEGRLETAKKLREEVVDLKMLYESGTVAAMQDLRTKALPRPLPEDNALFSEVDSVLTEIRRCYMEMDRFWTEEISRAIEALRMRRVDPKDFERWKTFQANLTHTIDSWKV